MDHAVLLVRLAGALALLAGCFEPSYPEGAACGPDGWCPPGQSCDPGANICRVMSTDTSDATLRDLQISAVGTLEPGFSPERVAYELEVSLLVQELRISALATHTEASVTIDGMAVLPGEASPPIALDLGKTEIAIEVMAPDGNSQRYTLSVNRGSDIVQHTYGKASNTGAGDEFGWSVAVWGDTLAVGAWHEDSAATGPHGPQGPEQVSDSALDSGAVYVFRRTGDRWVQEAYLKASNPEAADFFGISLALWEDTLAVGASFEDSDARGPQPGAGDGQPTNVATNSGAVYIFRRSGTSWAQEAYVKASDTDDYDYFGRSVALWGETLAVGAFRQGNSRIDGAACADKDASAEASGAVYVFRRSGTAWTQEAKLEAVNRGNADNFGWSVSLWGDVLAVGAYCEDGSGAGVFDAEAALTADNDDAPNSGAVYVFRREGTSWSPEAYLKATNGKAEDRFGISVALWGETLAVSASYEDRNAAGEEDGAPDSGAVYVFRREGTSWSPEAYLKASNAGANDEFGGSLALWNDLLAVGAPGEDSNASGAGEDLIDSGAVYVYRRSGTAWNQDGYVKASNPGSGDKLGGSLALSGDTLVIGVNYEDSADTGVHGARDGNQGDNSAEESGAVYLFH